MFGRAHGLESVRDQESALQYHYGDDVHSSTVECENAGVKSQSRASKTQTLTSQPNVRSPRTNLKRQYL